MDQVAASTLRSRNCAEIIDILLKSVGNEDIERDQWLLEQKHYNLVDTLFVIAPVESVHDKDHGEAIREVIS
jgi:hypothetical protein